MRTSVAQAQFCDYLYAAARPGNPLDRESVAQFDMECQSRALRSVGMGQRHLQFPSSPPGGDRIDYLRAACFSRGGRGCARFAVRARSRPWQALTQACTTEAAVDTDQTGVNGVAALTLVTRTRISLITYRYESRQEAEARYNTSCEG